MDNPTDEAAFLRDLVKSARQRIHQVKWVDRDGSARLTMLNQAELTRLQAIATARKLSREELLRQTAHIPVVRKPLEA